MGRENAETMATRQRDISVSEFFAKNKHLLGFDNPKKALLTAVKEAVDNSLDACEEAGILPTVYVILERTTETRYKMTVIDNGPGITPSQIANVFGRLLYGSKFHRLKMSRGQQGIGISAAGMYGLLTTGKPVTVRSRTKAGKPARWVELSIDLKTNRANVTRDEETNDFPATRLRPALLHDLDTGTSVAIEMEGRYTDGFGSIRQFLEFTSIANPHAEIVLIPGALDSDPIIFPRNTDTLPDETTEIQPHPQGVELGMLRHMVHQAEHDDPNQTMVTWLETAFSSVSHNRAREMCSWMGFNSRHTIRDLNPASLELLHDRVQVERFPPPSTDCLAAIGVSTMLKGITGGIKAEFYTASTREPSIYRGRPFQVEAAIAFGGDLPTENEAQMIRFANRVPLLFREGSCCCTVAARDVSWKNYNLQQPRSSLPTGPLVIMVHVASVWVPFSNEAKEAIAEDENILTEIKKALQECGRKLGVYLKKREAMKRQAERRDVFKRYIPEVATALHRLTGAMQPKLVSFLERKAKEKTALADAQLTEDGAMIRGEQDLRDDPTVVIVENQ